MINKTIFEILGSNASLTLPAREHLVDALSFVAEHDVQLARQIAKEIDKIMKARVRAARAS